MFGCLVDDVLIPRVDQSLSPVSVIVSHLFQSPERWSTWNLYPLSSGAEKKYSTETMVSTNMRDLHMDAPFNSRTERMIFIKRINTAA
jgi:hypothetical protein